MDIKIKLYNVWRSMRQRCNNKNCESYPRYGGRGIKICFEWDDFNVFYLWAISNGYEIINDIKNKLTIERINNNVGYNPSNCKFATYKEQSTNKRNNFIVKAFGECKIIKEWSKDPRCLVSATCLRKRIHNGWNSEEALTIGPTFYQHEAFGERKTLNEWANDERCLVAKKTLRNRFFEGWSMERAITIPLKQSKEYEAFGEKKTIAEWGRDIRCVVNTSTLLERITRQRWQVEKALTTKTENKNKIQKIM